MAVAAFSQNVSPIDKALLASNRKANESKADIYIQSKRIIFSTPQTIDTALSGTLTGRKHEPVRK